MKFLDLNRVEELALKNPSLPTTKSKDNWMKSKLEWCTSAIMEPNPCLFHLKEASSSNLERKIEWNRRKKEEKLSCWPTTLFYIAHEAYCSRISAVGILWWQSAVLPPCAYWAITSSSTKCIDLPTIMPYFWGYTLCTTFATPGESQWFNHNFCIRTWIDAWFESLESLFNL